MDLPDPFTIEAWTYLGIDTVIVFLRLFGRWKTYGFRNFSIDDFFMIIALLLYTAETATAYWVGAYWQGLANSGMTDDYRASLDPRSHEYRLRVKGSQTQLFGWLVYTCLLWCLKLCWLLFYRELCDGVDGVNLRINIGFALILTTFLGTFFIILCGCYPVSKHWQIYPDPGNFCQPAVSKLQAWTLIITNLSTDFYIMMIPLPMVWNARMSCAHKMGLGIMFCGGFLTAVFGALRCGFILQDSKDGPQLAGEWSCRESFVAVLISNVPVLFSMARRGLRRVRDVLHDMSGSGNDAKTFGCVSAALELGPRTGRAHDKRKFKHPLSLPGETFFDPHESEENIIGTGRDRPSMGTKDSDGL